MRRKRTFYIIFSILVVLYGYKIKYLPVSFKLFVLTIMTFSSFFLAYAIFKHYRTTPIIVMSISMIISIVSITAIEYINYFWIYNKGITYHLQYIIGISSFLMISSIIYQLIKYGDKNSRIGGIICLAIFTIVGIGVVYILNNY